MADDYIFNLNLTDNSAEIMQLEEEGIEVLLEAIGEEAEGDVVISISSPDWIPKEPIDTGNLKNNITHQVSPHEKAVYIGTAVEYAPYVEFGTGDMGAGDGPKWTYRDDEGKFHRTSGMRPRPFLKRAIRSNIKKYKQIAADALRRAFE